MSSKPRKTIMNQTIWALVSLVCVSLLILIWSDWGGLAKRINDKLKPTPAIGGEFSLLGTNGKTITDKDLVGKPTALFFGYTFCPDVCPTTLYEATNWLARLGPDGDRIQVFFVTVDPGRDTIEHLSSYMSAFDRRIVGLTGTHEAVAKTIKAYRVYVERTEGGDEDTYLVNHTASVYLLGKDGQFVDTIAYQEHEAKALEKLRYLIRS